jgi:5-methylcytosine-specific restriction protein B
MAETSFPVRRTPDRVRRLSAQDLDLPTTFTGADHASNRPDDPPLEADDPRLSEVRDLLKTYGGVILTGPPGTSKSWYAAKLATALTDGDVSRVRFVQFHPSYQYEDFVQGFVPMKSGEGFQLVGKHLLEMCATAADHPDKTVVLVIDELSRGDPGRIFGEALTYVEKTKRSLAFRLASGDEAVIPDNLVFLATMNPLDRGVDEVDAAFERRFAKIAMDPDVSILETFLDDNGVGDPLRGRIIGFFRAANKEASANPYTAVGHTFFLDVRDSADVRRLWEHQLRFLFEKAYRLDPEGFNEMVRNYARITDLTSPSGSDQADDEGPTAVPTGDPDSD